MKYLVLTLLFCCTLLPEVSSQYVYKTPSGAKYHRYTCRMVDNVSKKISLKNAIIKHGLKPCKICSPPTQEGMTSPYSGSNKAVGKCTSVQCAGTTKKGNRCKHRTRMCNGYCYQHNPESKKYSPSDRSRSHQGSSETSSTCGARTKSSGYCKRKVKGGGRCYQH